MALCQVREEPRQALCVLDNNNVCRRLRVERQYRVGNELMELPQESYEHLRRNVNFVLDTGTALLHQRRSHRNSSSASQKMTKSCGPAPRAISSPPHGRLRKHPLHRLLASVLLLAMMQILLTMCQWMTPAQGNLMLDPPMKPTPLVPECTVTSHPHGCAVSTLHRIMLSLSQVNALCVWSSTSVARSCAQHVGTSPCPWTSLDGQRDKPIAARRSWRDACRSLQNLGCTAPRY